MATAQQPDTTPDDVELRDSTARDIADRAVAALVEQLRTVEDPVLRYHVTRQLWPIVKREVAKIPREAAQQLYERHHLNTPQIGARFGITPQAVGRLVRGVDYRTGKRRI